MRTYFLFKINKDIALLTHNNSYSLFKTINDLYYIDNINLGLSIRIYEQIFSSFNVDNVNKLIDSKYKNNRYYFKNGDIHLYLNKYKPENTSLKVNRSHILLKTDHVKPTFLFDNFDNNIFVCDFKNKDYFWLDELSVKT